MRGWEWLMSTRHDGYAEFAVTDEKYICWKPVNLSFAWPAFHSPAWQKMQVCFVCAE
jgi:hypothetical protein